MVFLRFLYASRSFPHSTLHHVSGMKSICESVLFHIHKLKFEAPRNVPDFPISSATSRQFDSLRYLFLFELLMMLYKIGLALTAIISSARFCSGSSASSSSLPPLAMLIT